MVNIVRVGPLKVDIELVGEPAYGRILGTDGLGADGGHLRAYVGPEHESPLAVILHLCNVPDRIYLHDCVLLGFTTEMDALSAWAETGGRKSGREVVAWCATTTGSLADALDSVADGTPCVFASPESWKVIVEECEFAGSAPMWVPVEPVPEPDEDDAAPIGDRYPWHARNRWGAYVAEPGQTGAERYGWPPQQEAVAESYPQEETMPLGDYAEYVSPVAGRSARQELARKTKRFTTNLTVDKVEVTGGPRVVPGRMAKVVATLVREITARKPDVTPGEAWIEALARMQREWSRLYLDVGYTPTGRERRVIATMVANRIGRAKRKPLGESAPPGWEKAVKLMKRQNVENPWALAWHLHKKGVDPEDYIGSRGGRKRRKPRKS